LNAGLGRVGDGGAEQQDREQVFRVAGQVDRDWLMPAHDRISRPAQILRQINLHLDGRLERHRVQMFVQFWQKVEAVAFDHRGCFDAGFVVGEAFLECQAGHPHVNTGLLGVAFGILCAHLTSFANYRVEQDDVNIVMELWFMARAVSFESPVLHPPFSPIGFKTGADRCNISQNNTLLRTCNANHERQEAREIMLIRQTSAPEEPVSDSFAVASWYGGINMIVKNSGRFLRAQILIVKLCLCVISGCHCMNAYDCQHGGWFLQRTSADVPGMDAFNH
jgi:hypothetical protein